jgi:hypothetical protein
MSDFTDWTDLPQLVHPSAADPTALTPDATPWNNSAYAQITSGFSQATIITGFSTIPKETGLWRIDLATGGAGAEVVIGTWGDHAENLAGRTHYHINPAVYVPAGTAISARIRKAGTSTTAWGIKIHYFLVDLVPPTPRRRRWIHPAQILGRGGGRVPVQIHAESGRPGWALTPRVTRVPENPRLRNRVETRVAAAPVPHGTDGHPIFLMGL